MFCSCCCCLKVNCSLLYSDVGHRACKSLRPPYILSVSIHDLVLYDSSELCSLSHTGVTATAESSTVCFIVFHPTKTCLEGGNYYADKLLFSNYLHIEVIMTLNTHIYEQCSVVCAHVKYR